MSKSRGATPASSSTSPCFLHHPSHTPPPLSPLSPISILVFKRARRGVLNPPYRLSSIPSIQLYYGSGIPPPPPSLYLSIPGAPGAVTHGAVSLPPNPPRCQAAARYYFS